MAAKKALSKFTTEPVQVSGIALFDNERPDRIQLNLRADYGFGGFDFEIPSYLLSDADISALRGAAIDGEKMARITIEVIPE